MKSNFFTFFDLHMNHYINISFLWFSSCCWDICSNEFL